MRDQKVGDDDVVSLSMWKWYNKVKRVFKDCVILKLSSLKKFRIGKYQSFIIYLRFYQFLYRHWEELLKLYFGQKSYIKYNRKFRPRVNHFMTFILSSFITFLLLSFPWNIFTTNQSLQYQNSLNKYFSQLLTLFYTSIIFLGL